MSPGMKTKSTVLFKPRGITSLPEIMLSSDAHSDAGEQVSKPIHEKTFFWREKDPEKPLNTFQNVAIDLNKVGGTDQGVK
jgi:hypothetical protein